MSYTFITLNKSTILLLVATDIFAILCVISDLIMLGYFVKISLQFVEILFGPSDFRSRSSQNSSLLNTSIIHDTDNKKRNSVLAYLVVMAFVFFLSVTHKVYSHTYILIESLGDPSTK